MRWIICVALISSILSSGCNRNNGEAKAEPMLSPPTVMNDHDSAHERVQRITIDNFTYDPRSMTIAAGTKVIWLNRDDVPHTATSTAKPRAFDSGTLDTDETFAHIFSTPGTYEYYCALHPKMTATIIVK